MISKDVAVRIEGGLEARPLAMLVQIAGKYNCVISFESQGRKVNGKSIMGMMTLGLDEGDSVNVIADGADEREAVSEIEKLLRTVR